MAVERAQSHEQAIDKVRAENRKLIEGDPKATELSQMGIRQVRMELDKLLWTAAGRGSIASRRSKWPRRRHGRDHRDHREPDPPGIADKTVLYAFEEADVQKRGDTWASST